MTKINDCQEFKMGEDVTIKGQNSKGNGTLPYPNYGGSHMYLYMCLFIELYTTKKVNFTV